MSMSKRCLSGLVILCMSLSAGCTVGPDYRVPEATLSSSEYWNMQVDSGAPVGFEHNQSEPDWWKQFNDPYLSDLVDDLIVSNLTLAQARERVVAARAKRGIVNAGRLPQLDLEGSLQHAAAGDESISLQGPNPGQEADVYRFGAAAGWELELWGRIERLLEAEDRDIEAEREAASDIAVSLIAELTLTYIEARTLEVRLALADKAIDLNRQWLSLAQARENAGNGTRLEKAVVRSFLEQAQALKPELDRQYRLALNSLDGLLGKTPQGQVLPVGRIPQAPLLLGLGLPADLLLRRADIRQAERQYAASVARIGAAMAERYPRISLSGTFFLQSRDAGGLYDPDAFVYSFGPTVQFPLFSGGRIQSQVATRRSEAQQARLSFEQKIIAAVKEVENSIIGVIRTQERQQDMLKAMSSAAEVRAMTQDLYAAGLANLDEVIVASTKLLSAQEDLARARQGTLTQTVLLYRALGGGWAAVDLNRAKGSERSFETTLLFQEN